jgi:carbon-monoxide dehydrogenase large subunit
VCEVEVDPLTGAVDVLKYYVVDDVGTMVNPIGVKGQIHGGVAQGLGQALMEQVVYDPDSGQLLSGSFMDYAMPRAADMPPMKIESNAVPTKLNPMGAKGAGEAGTVGALPAVMNAVIDAMSTEGVTSLDMPASPQRVWAALRAAKQGAKA